MERSSWRPLAEFGGFGVGSCLRASKSVAFAGLTCAFAVGGAMVGAITGALKGSTTETGLLRGAGIGAVAGALVSVDLLESLLHGDPLSKIAMFESLVNGKIFREWVSPAMLTAYQWQVSTIEVVEGEASDIFDTSCKSGMLPEAVQKLPKFEVCSMSTEPSVEACCAVCLRETAFSQASLTFSRHSPRRQPWSPPSNRSIGIGRPGKNLLLLGLAL